MKTYTKIIALLFALTGLAHSQTVQQSVAKLHSNAQALEDIVNGPASGAGSEVPLPNGGLQETVAKALLSVRRAFSDSIAAETSATLSSLDTSVYSEGESVLLADGLI